MSQSVADGGAGVRRWAQGRTLVIGCALVCGAGFVLLCWTAGLVLAFADALTGALGAGPEPVSSAVFVVVGLAVVGSLLGAFVGMVAVAVNRARQSPGGLRTFPGELASLTAETPGVAVVLSFVLPGLGQAAVGKSRRGAMVAIPAIALTAAVGLLALFDRSAFYQVLNSQVLFSLLLLDAVALLYHLWAMLDAHRLAGLLRPVAGRSRRWLSLGSVVVLVAVTLGIHGWFAAVVVRSEHTLGCTFNPNGPCGIGDLTPGETYVPVTMDPSEMPTEEPTFRPWIAAGMVVLDPAQTTTPVPSETPAGTVPPFTGYTEKPPAYEGDPADWAADGYLNVLLIGGDAGIGRGGNAAGKRINLRTDTLILLRVELDTGRSVMFGIPRNLYNAPLGEKAWDAYACHCYPKSQDFYYGLWTDAALLHPDRYPYSGNYFARGTKAIEDSVGSLLGLHVDGAVVVDLMGFVNLIDAIAPHGLTVNVPYEVRQMAGYGYNRPEDGKNIYGIVIKKGVQKMDGHKALQYVRLRHIVGYDSDYFRMGRQQLVLKAVRDQLNPCELLPRVTTLLTALEGTIWTDFSTDDAPALAALAAKISTKNIRSVALTPANGFDEFVNHPGAWQKYKDTAARGLDFVPSAYSGGSGGGTGFHC
jgi:LCP family protein required for cell wall assembly